MVQLSDILYSLNIFALFANFVVSECPNLCNKRGLCDKYNVCHCSEGFTGGDCSLRTCPMGLAWADQASYTDVSHNLAVCSNRGNVVAYFARLTIPFIVFIVSGVCDQSFGTCSCLQGFTGTACERLDCENSCGGNGRCFSMHDYASKFRDSNSHSYTYHSVWDASKITGMLININFLIVI